MKKIFGFLMTVALLFTASCAKEDISSNIAAGGEVEVTLTVDVPELGTRALGDGMTVDQVFLAVYEVDGTEALAISHLDGTDPIVNGKATMTVVLLKDKTYDLVFWAQKSNTGAYNLTGLADGRKVVANYGAKCNLEDRDAFFLIRDDWTAGVDETTFTLKRPFAQINVANSDEDVANVKANGVEIKTSALTVKTQVCNTLNMLTGGVENKVDVAFAKNDIPTDTFYIDGYNYLAMNYLLVNEKELVDLEFVFTDNANTEYTRPYYAVPVQRNYRTNILGQIISSPIDFTVIIDPIFEGEHDIDAKTQIFDVATDEELLEALTTKVEDHIEHLIINLKADVTLDVAPRLTKAIGGKYTKDITINGAVTRSENYTLTFNNTNSDWNNIATNGAKLILNNLTITNSGHDATSGTWNAHDLYFVCDVEMNNVTSLNAIALGANATIKDSSIADDSTSSAYALWIVPNGQTVNIENCNIDSTGANTGRGIKIDNQYVDSPAKVVLNISNTKFVTEEKAAILVKSPAGAEINASNLDITGVVEDSVYAVWVDEDAAAYFDLVSVTGANMRLEGSAIVNTQEQLDAAIANGGHIMLAEGEYTLPTNTADVTIIGTNKEEVIVSIPKQLRADNKTLTLKNLTTKVPTGLSYTEFDFAFIHYYKQFNMINCNSDGRIRINCYEANIEGCTFDVTTKSGFDGYAIYYYGPTGSKVTVSNCIFNTVGKGIVMFNEGKKGFDLTVENCEFNSSDSTTDKCAVQMHTEKGIYGTLNINNSTATGFAAINDGLWNELNNENGNLTNNFEKFVDGVQVYNDVTIVNGEYNIYSAEGLKWFANEVNVNKNAFTGKTVKLGADIDLNNVVWTPIGQTGATTFNGVFDGQNFTISNLNIDSEAQTGTHYSSGLFGWVESHTEGCGILKNVKINGATVNGHHNCGALVGYITQQTALVENCHVTGATITCTYANGEADGDKAGALIGNATVATPVKDCTAADSTVSAGRDAGQVIGAGKEANVTGCSATDVTVTANGTGTGANVRNEVIGRLL